MLEDKEKYQKQADEKAKKLFESQDTFDEFISFTLNNFGYRYFDKDPDENAVEMSAPLTYFIRQETVPLKWGLMNKDPKIKNASKELALAHPPKEGGALCQELEVRLEHRDANRSGVATFSARLYWNYPTFTIEAGKYFEKTYEFAYEDALHLRNKMAKHLEEICELFA